MQQQAALFLPPDSRYLPLEQVFFKNIIEDRGSKYSVLCVGLTSCTDPKRQAKLFSHGLKKENFFRKATHNTYAWRYTDDDGILSEGYTDDRETGAGLCILREMRKENVVNGLIVVTRYYGGIKLDGDRLRHVIDATKYGLGRISQ